MNGWEMLEKARWPENKCCPYCGSEKISRHAEKTKSRWQCSWCRKSFTATVGTFLHNTHIPLEVWFNLIRIILERKKDFSASEAARILKLRYATALSMVNRIKAAKDDKLLKGLEGVLCLAIKPSC